jgi:hypothetical protein
MLRLLTCVLAVGCVGTSAMLVQRDMGTRHSQSFDARQAADGAFRDGLYLGKLDRTAKNPMHPAVGRWATEKDRELFVAGYRQGYNEQNVPQ